MADRVRGHRLGDVVFLGEHLHAAKGEIVVAALEIDARRQLLRERPKSRQRNAVADSGLPRATLQGEKAARQIGPSAMRWMPT